MSADPTDLVPSPSPSPGNPFSDTPSTSPVAIASPTGQQQKVDPGTPPADFVASVNTALQFRLGATKYALIPAADKKALIAKIWQDPSIQSAYITAAGRLKSDPTIAGQFGGLINNVMLGQGNDPTVAVDYTNMLQAAGVPLSTSEQGALSGATQAVNAPVPRPFNTATISGYRFGDPMPPGGWIGTGQSFGWDKHYGNDYGTKAGDRVVSPFAGTVHVASGVDGYGNIVYVTLDNGWTMGFGHVANGTVQNGQRVNPGDLVAIAGHNIGSAQGSVTLVTWQDPSAKFDKNGVLQGGYHDPGDVLNPIFNGATFSTLAQAVPNEIGAGASGTGMPSINKVLDTEYPSIKSDWQTFFGTPPSPEDVYDVLNHGSSPAQWSDYIRSLPSHIDGLNQGQYYDMRSMADKVSTQVLGHPATDSIVAELHDAGLTSQQAVTNWYNEHGVTGIDQSTYQEIYKSVTPIMSGIFGESAGADPRTIKAIHDGQQGHPGPQEG